MRSVGSKAGLAGVARLVAVGLAMGLTTLHPAAASTSGNNEPDHYKGDPWNWPVLNTEELAQQVHHDAQRQLDALPHRLSRTAGPQVFAQDHQPGLLLHPQ